MDNADKKIEDKLEKFDDTREEIERNDTMIEALTDEIQEIISDKDNKFSKTVITKATRAVREHEKKNGKSSRKFL